MYDRLSYETTKLRGYIASGPTQGYSSEIPGGRYSEYDAQVLILGLADKSANTQHYLHLTNETMQCGVVLLRSRLPSQSWESLVVHIGRVEHWRLRNPVQETYNFDMKFDQRTCQITAIPSEEFVEVLIKAAK